MVYMECGPYSKYGDDEYTDDEIDRAWNNVWGSLCEAVSEVESEYKDVIAEFGIEFDDMLRELKGFRNV